MKEQIIDELFFFLDTFLSVTIARRDDLSDIILMLESEASVRAPPSTVPSATPNSEYIYRM